MVVAELESCGEFAYRCKAPRAVAHARHFALAALVSQACSCVVDIMLYRIRPSTLALIANPLLSLSAAYAVYSVARWRRAASLFHLVFVLAVTLILLAWGLAVLIHDGLATELLIHTPIAVDLVGALAGFVYFRQLGRQIALQRRAWHVEAERRKTAEQPAGGPLRSAESRASASSSSDSAGHRALPRGMYDDATSACATSACASERDGGAAVWPESEDGFSSSHECSGGIAVVRSTGVGAGAGVEGAACVLCLDRPREMCLAPCGHVCLCGECYEQLRLRSHPRRSDCPLCRRPVDSALRAYY